MWWVWENFKCENQLSVHSQKHEIFTIQECDCEFNFEGLLEKHSKAVHGRMKMFCDYYNNDKECPYDIQCVYAHEESPDCMFGKGCERIMCMFQHEDSYESDNDDDNESDNDEDDEDDKIKKVW